VKKAGMKTILVPLDEGPALPSVLKTVLLAAQKFDAYVEAMHIRPGLTGVVAVGAEGLVAATPGLIESFEREDHARSDRVRAAFETYMGENALTPATGTAPPSGPSFGWHEETAQGDVAVASRGRVFDLVAVGRPTRGGPSTAMSMLEAALFESGRPILIAPPVPPKSLGRRILVAWNGSTETARALAFAMPFLTSADDVLVLSVEGGAVPGPSAEDCARGLTRNGIAASTKAVRPEKRSVGETVLKESADWGADLLIKGAYTQSRLRQMIFGGSTSHILSEATLPVFMAN
jgi:nucleotide-binding universal stress UspA family protein